MVPNESEEESEEESVEIGNGKEDNEETESESGYWSCCTPKLSMNFVCLFTFHLFYFDYAFVNNLVSYYFLFNKDKNLNMLFIFF